MAVSPAAAQTTCSGGAEVGDYVWFDTDNNGRQDPGEVGIANAVVSLVPVSNPAATVVTSTDPSGFYLFFDLCPGDYKVIVQTPNMMHPSPANVMGVDDTLDSDGEDDGLGNGVAQVTVPDQPVFQNFTVDFGFWQTPVAQPGTATPGYWKNHPEAWPVQSIIVGEVTYTKDEAIAWLWTNGSDKTLTMFSSLVSAMLSVAIGNDDSCVASTIVAANDWMAAYGPAGSKVHASSLAWKLGEPLHRHMDNYNNGMLCAPHRE